MFNNILFDLAVVAASGLLLFAGPASSQDQSSGPQIVLSIRCLQLSAETLQPTDDHYLVLTKIASAAGEITYSIEAGQKSQVDYGMSIDFVQPGRFTASNAVASVELEIQDLTLSHFQNPKNMEPFLAAYSYQNIPLNQKESFQVKCLHQIF